MTVAVRVESLTKQYRLRRSAPMGYRTLREDLMRLVTSPRRWLRRASSSTEPFQALADVSFEVRQAEVVGIVGRNGAGKSTLLKILSRITRPTSGRVQVRGRVGSLLEVGTGFHPELSGRENVFLNGALLGMRRREIARKFDQIVAFAETERFLDTPVKHYSSGMYMRLAFAVAAHLEPEILLVDEVLAVGDAAFQRKCLGKMGEVAQQGRTILFVSHNMGAIKRLCQRAIFLHAGRVQDDGDAVQVVKSYLQGGLNASQAERVWPDVELAPGNDQVRLQAVRVRDAHGRLTPDVDSSECFEIEVDYANLRAGSRLGVTVVLYNADEVCVLGSISNLDPQWHGVPRDPGVYRSVCRLHADFFPDGPLDVSILLWGDGYGWAHREDHCLTVNIHETERSVRGDYCGAMAGTVRPKFPWTTQRIDDRNAPAGSNTSGENP